MDPWRSPDCNLRTSALRNITFFFNTIDLSPFMSFTNMLQREHKRNIKECSKTLSDRLQLFPLRKEEKMTSRHVRAPKSPTPHGQNKKI